jgi:hypothetical protein
MKPSNLSLIAGLLLICLCAASPASAIYYDINYTDEYSGLSSYVLPSSSSYSSATTHILLYLEDSATPYKYNGLYFLGVTFTTGTTQIQDYDTSLRIDSASSIPIILYSDVARTNQIGTADISWNTEYNYLGSAVSTDLWMHISNFDYTEISGHLIYFDCVDPDQMFRFYTLSTGPAFSTIPGSDPTVGRAAIIRGTAYYAAGTYNVVIKGAEWEQQISGTHSDGMISQILLDRQNSYSNFTVYDDSQTFIQDYSTNNLDYDILAEYYTYRIVSPYGTIFTESFLPDIPVTPTVSILASVLSTADDALIGGATLNFNSTAHNVSQTLTSGYGLYTLYPGVEYTVSASADNYQEELSTNPTITFGGDSRYDYYLKPVYGVENGTVQLNFYVSTANTAGSGYLKVPNALITLNSASTLITNDAGYAYATLNRSGSISYTITKSGYKTYSRSFTPNWETWSSDTFEEYVTLLAEGVAIGNITPTPTPDTRDYNQKAESAFSFIFDNIEVLSELAVVVLILSLIGMITGGGKKK